MTAFWTEPDFDDHELVQMVYDRASGLQAIIALHSTYLGPGAGGTRFWHYAEPEKAMRDALRLSRGMSYKNAMAGLPLGGGKAVILADSSKTKTPEMMAAFGKAINDLAGAYITAEDVGMSEADMVAISEQTAYVSGLPPKDEGEAGGDPGPFTARGIALGIAAAVKHRLGRDDMDGVHVAIQGTGSVGGGVARILAKQGAKLTLADIDASRAAALADELGADHAPADAVIGTKCDVFSPNALGGMLDDDGIAKLNCAIVAGGANNQLAKPAHGQLLAMRGILYAPDYVLNAGGIISVASEYLAKRDGKECSVDTVYERIAQIPQRLTDIWQQSESTGESADRVADAMAQHAIGR